MSDGAVGLKQRIEARRAKMSDSADSRYGVKTLPIGSVKPWPKQPRKYFNKQSLADLARSIEQVGQKVPIMVSPDPESPGKFLLDDGERRLRACLKLGHNVIRAIVLPTANEDERLIRSVVANFGREGHTPYEVALVLKQIYNTNRYTHHEIAAMFAKSNCWVSQHMSLTKLDPRVIALTYRDIPFESRLKFMTAILLTPLPGDLQFEIAKTITDKKMGLKAARHYVEVKAAEAGFKVGGIASRPEKRRKSLMSLAVGVAESLPSFLELPDIPLPEFLEGFKNEDLAKLIDLVERCRHGMSVLFQTATEIYSRKKRAPGVLATRAKPPKQELARV